MGPFKSSDKLSGIGMVLPINGSTTSGNFAGCAVETTIQSFPGNILLVKQAVAV